MGPWIKLFFVFLFLGPFGASLLRAQECEHDQMEIDTYLYSTEDFGQSFLPCGTGELYRIDIPAHSFQAFPIEARFSILEGEGFSGPVLHVDTVTLSDDWGGVLIHTFDDPVQLNSGQIYTYRLEFLSGFGAIWANFTNAYPEGQLFWNGEAQPTIDMGFIIHMTLNLEPGCITWTGAIDDEWWNPGNWYPQQVPDSMDCVIVPAMDQGVYPKSTGEVHIFSLLVEEGASLELVQSARLTVFEDLTVLGEADFKGEVVMHALSEPGEITGSPAFHRLRIEGIQLLSEPIDVFDVLDLEEGYMVNLGTELVMNRSSEHLGHLYMPSDRVEGEVTYRATEMDDQEGLIGIPFTSLDTEDLQELQELSLEVFEESEEGPQLSWSTDEEAEAHQGAAYRVPQGLDTLQLKGLVDNATWTREGTHSSMDGTRSHLMHIGNPYPSHIDLDEILFSEGTPHAIYRWNAEAGQFSADLKELAIHDKGDRLAPMEAFFVQIPEDGAITFDYQDVVIHPSELEDAPEMAEGQGSLRLMAELQTGMDEIVIAFDPESSPSLELDKDAPKIMSMLPGVPSLASMDVDGQLLAIQCLPFPHETLRIPLAFRAGDDGFCQWSLTHWEVQDDYDKVWLEDVQEGIFHDLVVQGDYVAEVSTADDMHRFVLHFQDRSGSAGQLPSEALVPVSLDPDAPEGPFEISTIREEVVISPAPGWDFIPALTRISVYDSAGRLVSERQTTGVEALVRMQLHVSPGVYSIQVHSAIGIEFAKAWID